MRVAILGFSLCLLAPGCRSKEDPHDARGGASAAASASTVGASGAVPATPNVLAPPDVGAPPSDAEKTAGGVLFRVVTPGNGVDHPRPTDLVTILYTGWTRGGDTLENTPAPVGLVVETAVPAFAEMLPGMVEGEQRRMWTKGSLLLGNHPEDVTYDLTLVKVVKKHESPPPVPAPEDVKEAPKSATRTKSGLAYRVLTPGRGKRPKASDTVTASYSGWTPDGKMFDSSTLRKAPLVFRLDQVIKGWTEGLQLMHVGEKARFWIPAALAYGETPSKPGAPAGPLVFDIELLDVK